jgi:hypothetical protein
MYIWEGVGISAHQALMAMSAIAQEYRRIATSVYILQRDARNVGHSEIDADPRWTAQRVTSPRNATSGCFRRIVGFRS